MAPHDGAPDADFDPLRDRLFRGGTVLTMDPARPRAEALAVRGGRVLAVGSEEEVAASVARDPEVIELEGGVLLPGFHDAHVHVTLLGFSRTRLSLADVDSLEQAVARVEEEARRAPDGAWIQGGGFATERWGVDRLDRESLDAVAPHNPVLLRSQDLHAAWVNGAALDAAGVHAGTSDPRGGVVLRRADGAPSGHLLERAVELILRAVPAPEDEHLDRAQHAAAAHLASVGVTTAHHMAYEPASHWRRLAANASGGAFPVRVWACIPHEAVEAAAASGLATGQGGERFTVGGAKFFADGALGSRTSWMLAPYDGGEDRGMVIDDPDVLAERVPLAVEARLAPVIHAIGDAAGRVALDVLEAEAPNWTRYGLRPRVEHAQHLESDDVARLGRLGLVASMQPQHLAFDVATIKRCLATREDRAYPVRALLDAGAVVAFGSDAPVAPPLVFDGMRAAVGRSDARGRTVSPEHAVDSHTALAAYTTGGAAAIGRAGRSGVLRRGADADLVALSHDRVADPQAPEVRFTAVAGRLTYRG